MEKREIYFKRNQELERINKKLELWDGNKDDKEIIRLYQHHLSAKGTGQLRRAKLTSQLMRISSILNKNLKEATETDIEKILAKINEIKAYTPITKADYRRAIKEFYNWYEEKDPRIESSDEKERKECKKLYTYIKKYVKTTAKKEQIEASDLISWEDCNLLIENGCSSIMEKALIRFLHETGVRVGELLGMRIKDIEIKEKHALIQVDGKTGKRKVPAILSIPYLIRWLEEHPEKNNLNAYVWVSKHNGHFGKPLMYIGVSRLLKRVFIKAGLKKKYNPHWFRHSRATIYGEIYQEPILKKIMGWTPNSRMTETYVHIGDKEAEDRFLKINNLKIDDNKNEPSFISCVCGCINDSSARYCFKCGKPLSVKILIEDEEQKRKAIDEALELFTMIMSNAELKDKFEKFKKSQI